MKLNKIQVDRLVRKIFEELKKQDLMQFKESEEKVFKRAVAIVEQDYAREAELDREVNRMIDDLERKNAGEFERYKMFPLLKRKLAKDKGIIL